TQAPLEGLVQTLPPGRDRAAALWLLATVEGEHVRAAESERLLVMALAESDEDLALSARINVDLAHMAIFAGTLPTGLRHARYGAELAQSVGEDDLLAEALAVFALTHFVAGEPFDTGVLDRALELERLGRSIRLDRSPSMVR